MFSTLLECSKHARKPIIADGSISENGDITKALVAGASMVMAGSLFASCKDSPADSLCNLAEADEDQITHKAYFGSASAKNGNTKNIEGREVIIPCNGMTYQEKLIEIQQDLSSSLSYAGGAKLIDLQKVHYQVVK